MAAVFLHHVIGDLTVGKPDIREFWEGETVESAMAEIGESSERAVTVWRGRGEEMVRERAARFVGILNSLDLVAFLARECDREKAMRTPVREIVRHNSSLLKEIDPAARLIDALEMMKQGVERLLVLKSVAWKGVSKRFSVLYNGKWLKNSDSTVSLTSSSESNSLSSRTIKEDGYCCLSREDVLRFIIGCLGTIAPIPLSSISSLGALNDNYRFIEASSPALEILHNFPQNPCAAVVVETSAADGARKIIGEISAYKLWKCDHLAAAWAMANLSAGQFAMGSEDEDRNSIPDFILTSPPDSGISKSPRTKKFSSRSIGFFSQQFVDGLRSTWSMYRGWSAPLTCRTTSSLAAVMAQMLSHRSSHVWVTGVEPEENILVGIVSYDDILHAMTKNPASVSSPMP